MKRTTKIRFGRCSRYSSLLAGRKLSKRHGCQWRGKCRLVLIFTFKLRATYTLSRFWSAIGQCVFFCLRQLPVPRRSHRWPNDKRLCHSMSNSGLCRSGMFSPPLKFGDKTAMKLPRSELPVCSGSADNIWARWQETSFDIYAEDLNAGDTVRIFVLEDPGLPNGSDQRYYFDVWTRRRPLLQYTLLHAANQGPKACPKSSKAIALFHSLVSAQPVLNAPLPTVGCPAAALT
jgi:hypothetical protein